MSFKLKKIEKIILLLFLPVWLLMLIWMVSLLSETMWTLKEKYWISYLLGFLVTFLLPFLGFFLIFYLARLYSYLIRIVAIYLSVILTIGLTSLSFFSLGFALNYDLPYPADLSILFDSKTSVKNQKTQKVEPAVQEAVANNFEIKVISAKTQNLGYYSKSTFDSKLELKNRNFCSIKVEVKNIINTIKTSRYSPYFGNTFDLSDFKLRIQDSQKSFVFNEYSLNLQDTSIEENFIEKLVIEPSQLSNQTIAQVFEIQNQKSSQIVLPNQTQAYDILFSCPQNYPSDIQYFLFYDSSHQLIAEPRLLIIPKWEKL